MPLNNARIEKLGGWPWKLSVKRRRCIVPMTSFFEYSYWGEIPGHKLEFSCESRPTLMVAGIFDHHDNQYSMSVVTRPASEQMMDFGHHRMPLFVDQAELGDWLDGSHEIDECQHILTSLAIDPEFEVIDHGEMKTGWQTRVDGAIKKRDEQPAAIHTAGPLGI